MTGVERDPSQHGVSPEPFTRPLTDLVEMYLQRRGWIADLPGPAGALWRNRDVDAVIAVPKQLSAESVEWRGVVERLSSHERREATDIASAIRFQLTDITWLRASNERVIAGSIPLVAGASLVSSARVMLRSAATTAAKPRPQIGGHFSKKADEIAERARLGHTREGSYMIPVLMPLQLPEDERPEEPSVPGLEIELNREPEERRVTRTFAQALAAIDSVIVQPAREPKKSDLNAAVVAGASREFVRAVGRVLEDSSVAALDATFDWAEAVDAPGRVPAGISLPADAAPLLASAAQLLKTSTYSPGEILTGLIVEIRHEPDLPFGDIAIQTVRKGRTVEVRVRLDQHQLAESYDWARDSRAVLVDGRVRRSPGMRLQIDRPNRVHPLDESYLPGTAAALAVPKRPTT